MNMLIWKLFCEKLDTRLLDLATTPGFKFLTEAEYTRWSWSHDLTGVKLGPVLQDAITASYQDVGITIGRDETKVREIWRRLFPENPDILDKVLPAN